MDDRPSPSVDRHRLERGPVIGSGWRWIGWLFSLAALIFVGRFLWQADPTVWTKFRHLNIGLAIVSLLLLQVWFLLRFFMWELISLSFGVADERRSHLRMWAFSEFARYIPGNVWSFAARYRGSRQRGGSRPAATLSLIIEALNLVAGASIVALFFVRPGLWFLWLLGAGLYILAIPWCLQMIARWRKWEFTNARRYHGAVGLLGLSLMTWMVYGLAQALIIKAVPGLSTPNILILSAANVAAWLIGYLSIITPMGLGVREVALTSLLASSIAQGVGSVLAILTRVWLILSELVFLGSILIFSRKR